MMRAAKAVLAALAVQVARAAKVARAGLPEVPVARARAQVVQEVPVAKEVVQGVRAEKAAGGNRWHLNVEQELRWSVGPLDHAVERNVT